jgi:hypothetical protein
VPEPSKSKAFLTVADGTRSVTATFGTVLVRMAGLWFLWGHKANVGGGVICVGVRHVERRRLEPPGGAFLGWSPGTRVMAGIPGPLAEWKWNRYTSATLPVGWSGGN